MNKKVYVIPAIDVEIIKLTPLMLGSITHVGGDSGIGLGDGEIPNTADGRLFDDSDFNFDDSFHGE